MRHLRALGLTNDDGVGEGVNLLEDHRKDSRNKKDEDRFVD